MIIDFLSGIGGIGKSTALKYLALSWQRGRPELQRFGLVFHIALKDVNKGTSLPRIILDQHQGLAANNISEYEISVLLNGKYACKLLVLIDGFDEYRTGTNDQIDLVLNRSTLWGCWVVLTSRPFDQVYLIKHHFDAEASIIGFSDENINAYASKFLESEKHAKNFVETAQKNEILDILGIPIILQMMCVLFQSGLALPQSKTQTTRAIVDWSIKYSAYRKKHPRTSKSTQRELDNIFYKLGKLAWESLQSDIQQLLLQKVYFYHNILVP